MFSKKAVAAAAGSYLWRGTVIGSHFWQHMTDNLASHPAFRTFLMISKRGRYAVGSILTNTCNSPQKASTMQTEMKSM